MPFGGFLTRGEIITTEIAPLHEELRTFFAHRLPAPQDAEDFAQRVFERALAGNKTLDRALLFKIAHGLLKNEYRDNARRSPDEDERTWPGVRERTAILEMTLRNGDDEQFANAIIKSQESDNLEAGFVPSAEDQFFATDFDQAVRALDPGPRDAFILGELRGLTNREAGAILDTSHVTARVRRDAATTTIRKELTHA